MASSPSTAQAVVAVLTQRPLLQLIVSFQRGLPLVTGPFISRYLRAHLQGHDASTSVAGTTVNDVWDSPILFAIPRTWNRRYDIEIVHRDGIDDIRDLYPVFHLRSGNPARARYALLLARAATEAPTRDDVVVWFDETYGRAPDDDRMHPRYMTPLMHYAVGSRDWRWRVEIEAVVSYDDCAAFDMLGFLLRRCGADQRRVRRCVHDAWQTAAALGRVDVLAWLHETYSTPIAPAIARATAALAVRHGRESVLAWLETTFGHSVVETLRSCPMKVPVARGHLDAVRWMAQRQLGTMPVGAVYTAVAQRDVAMLRQVLTLHRPTTPPPALVSRFEARHGVALAKFAAATAHRDTLLCLMQHHCAFPGEFLEDAIARRDLEMVQCLLDNLHNQGVDRARRIVYQLIEQDDKQVLRMIARVKNRDVVQQKLGVSITLWRLNSAACDDVVRLLLEMSSVGDISCELVHLAVQDKTAHVEALLARVDRALPPDVLGFVDRVGANSLGPLASLAVTYMTDYGMQDAHVAETMVHWLPSASRQDARDLVLYLHTMMLCDGLDRVLAADTDRADGTAPHCDGAFLELCRSLRAKWYHSEQSMISVRL